MAITKGTIDTMQTFLPYSDFDESVACLDYKRLGKQRVEAYQILRTLTYGGSWAHHPAVLMWKGYRNALELYMLSCIQEWTRRGYRNTMLIPFYNEHLKTQVKYPPWLGNTEFHASHRANLLRKDFAWYTRYGWTENPSLPYIWPTHKRSVYYEQDVL